MQIYLEQNEQSVSNFIYEFEQRKLADEKNQHLNQFLSALQSEMKRNNIWKGKSCCLSILIVFIYNLFVFLFIFSC